jgi:peptidylprolyl isomerase/peptidyl-prolyl cis-trans isomerase D
MFDMMRRNTKLIMWITAAAFVLLIFLAWGAEYQIGGENRIQAGTIGRVNDDPIQSRVYQDRVAQARENFRAQPGRTLDEATEVMIRGQAWDQLVQDILIQQEIRRLGIQVSDKEIVQAIRNQPLPFVTQSPEFQTNNQFDYNKYLQALADPNRDWVPLENYYRMELPRQKLQNLVQSSVKVSEADVRRQFVEENRKAKVAYAFVPSNRFPVDTPNLAEADMQRYYDEHKDDYRSEGQCWVSYVPIDKKPSSSDSLSARDMIQQAATEVQQGEDFTTLVSAYSEATPQMQGGPSGSYLTREQIPQPQVRDAAFSLPVGGVSGILREANGFHVIRVEDRRLSGERDEVKIADIFIPITLSGETLTSKRDQALAIMNAVKETGVSLASAATTDGLTSSQAGPFGRRGFVPRLGQISGFMDFAFNAPEGSVSLMEGGDAYYVIRLERRRGSGVLPFEDVKERVRADYAVSLQTAQAKEKADAILARVRAGTPLASAAGGDSLVVFDSTDEFTRRAPNRGLGNDPAVLAHVFSAPVGLVPEAIGTRRGAYVIEVLTQTEPDESLYATQQETIRRQIIQRRRTDAMSRWMENLRASAKIEDYRGSAEI